VQVQKWAARSKSYDTVALGSLIKAVITNA